MSAQRKLLSNPNNSSDQHVLGLCKDVGTAASDINCFASHLISLIFLCMDINQEQHKVTARLAKPPILDPFLSSCSCRLLKRYRPQEMIRYMETSGKAPREAPWKKASVLKNSWQVIQWTIRLSWANVSQSDQQQRAQTAEPGERRVKTCFTSWDVLCSFVNEIYSTVTLTSWWATEYSLSHL